MTRSAHKKEKPKFDDPSKIKVNGEVQTKLIKKAKLANAAVGLYKKKKGKLTEEDLKQLEKESDA